MIYSDLLLNSVKFSLEIKRVVLVFLQRFLLTCAKLGKKGEFTLNFGLSQTGTQMLKKSDVGTDFVHLLSHYKSLLHGSTVT